jgi:hypothetical protein
MAGSFSNNRGKRKEEGGRRKEEGGRRKEEGGRRKEEGGLLNIGNFCFLIFTLLT